MFTRILLGAAVIGSVAVFASAEETMWYGSTQVLSVGGGGAANKSKLVRLNYNTPNGFVAPLVCVFGDAAGPDVWDRGGAMFSARDLFVTRSMDNGQTWSTPMNLSLTANLTSMMADHDGDPITDPLDYYGDSEKPNIFSSGKNIVVSWVDRYVPTLEQRSVVYPEFGNIEMPYAALYAVRSVDGGANWSVPERLTDGYRDAKADVSRGNGEGWIIVWQQDPQGLQPGDAEGPGEGGSGAKVSHGTDIWYSSLPAADLIGGVPFPPGVRLTDNFTHMGEGTNEGYEFGTSGASRPNLALMGRDAIVAYEETKGLEGLDFGKYVRYHVFSAFDDANPDVTNGVGWIISKPDENARRVRFVPQGTPGPNSGAKMFIFFKQGEYDQGGPSDIVGRVAVNGFDAASLTPAVDAGCLTREGAFSNARGMNMSSLAGLDSETGDNRFEDARAHRALIRGDFIAVGYSYTDDWAVARYTDLANYNFYLRRSFDGGQTWDEPRNLSNITDTTINVLEPRLIGTPKPADPADPRNTSAFFVGWGTEVNQYEHLTEGGIPLDIFVTRTTDKGTTYEPVHALAGTPWGEFESQLRTNGAGKRLFGVWQAEEPDGTKHVVFGGGLATDSDLNQDGVVSFYDLVIILSEWGDCPPPPAECPSDLNADGVVDFQDLLILLGSWT